MPSTSASSRSRHRCAVVQALPSPRVRKANMKLHTAWITLNNPQQLNSYTTEMVKGVIAGFQNASLDRSVVAVIFTGAGDRAFCTGGNTKEYSEYYSRRPSEYGEYMDLFNGMVDAILNDRKRILPAAAFLEGEYGIQGVYLGVPVKLGAGGVEQVLEVALTVDERSALERSADAVRQLTDALGV